MVVRELCVVCMLLHSHMDCDGSENATSQTYLSTTFSAPAGADCLFGFSDGNSYGQCRISNGAATAIIVIIVVVLLVVLVLAVICHFKKDDASSSCHFCYCCQIQGQLHDAKNSTGPRKSNMSAKYAVRSGASSSTHDQNDVKISMNVDPAPTKRNSAILTSDSKSEMSLTGHFILALQNVIRFVRQGSNRA